MRDEEKTKDRRLNRYISKSVEDRIGNGGRKHSIPSFRLVVTRSLLRRGRERDPSAPLPFIGAREHGELAGRARKARLESLVFHEHLSE